MPLLSPAQACHSTALVHCYHQAHHDSLSARRQLATSVFEAATAAGVQGNAGMYHSLMALHGDAGDVEEMLGVYDVMVEAGVKPAEVSRG